MSTDDQNRAIAKWLGKTYPCRDGEHVWIIQSTPKSISRCPAGYKCGKCWAFRWEGSSGVDVHDEAPATNYVMDLNAMHEAEETLSMTTRVIYVRYLRDVRSDNDIWHATAAQRAEAMLRTIGKSEWLETK